MRDTQQQTPPPSTTNTTPSTPRDTQQARNTATPSTRDTQQQSNAARLSASPPVPNTDQDGQDYTVGWQDQHQNTSTSWSSTPPLASTSNTQDKEQERHTATPSNIAGPVTRSRRKVQKVDTLTREEAGKPLRRSIRHSQGRR